MLYRWLVCLLFTGFVTAAFGAATADDKNLSQSIFELQRSVAILQLTTTRLEDSQMFAQKLDALEARVNFLTNLAFLLFMVGVVFFLLLRRQHKRLLAIEKANQMCDQDPVMIARR